MPVRPIVRYPDPALKRTSEPVGRVGGWARALAEDLVDTMRAVPACVGLAAPQIGVSARAICVDVTGHRSTTTCHGLVVLFDPVLVSSAAPEVRREGCLSVPHLTADVARATGVGVRGTTPNGEARLIQTEGFEARAFLHELDHLEGTLILDRVASPGTLFARKVYRS